MIVYDDGRSNTSSNLMETLGRRKTNTNHRISEDGLVYVDVLIFMRIGLLFK